MMWKLSLLLFNIFLNNYVVGYLEMSTPVHNNAMDLNLYENVLDPALCREQISYLLLNDTMLLGQFLDAGIRTPRGILTGNFADMGNYHQCLGIHQQTPESIIDGKYCMIEVPFSQPNLDLPSLPALPEWPDFPWPELNPNSTHMNEEKLNMLRKLKNLKAGVHVMHPESDRLISPGALTGLTFVVAVCLPKVCSTQQAIDGLLHNLTSLGFQYQERFCRLPNDKPWVAADYIATVVFSLIGVITILSTAYDIRHTIFLRKDPKHANKIYQSLSVYTNTRRLVTYTPVPGTLECLDGIRTLAMMWIILGHTFVNHLSGFIANPADAFEWMASPSSLWVSTSEISVDTFFMLSGLLVAYTTTGKLTRIKLLKKLHLFYLNRLLRMFPVLAAMVLIQASILNRVVDGPNWTMVADHTHHCRVYWWSTLLHVQNFVNPTAMCLAQTWYLAIDVQLHILSPLVLFWILGGRKRTAWLALTIAILLAVIPATVYNFIMEFPSGSASPEDHRNYMINYYVNTLTRCSPFFVGMIYGYLLHTYRNKKVVIPMVPATVLWSCAILIASIVLYSTYPPSQMDWDNRTLDGLINSFMRPMWALSIGWLVFACVHGYGGPVNWFLSLSMWKVPSRLSYAMYLVHFPIMFVVNGTEIAPSYFTVKFYLYEYMADLLLAVLLAFILTVVIDAPCSTLIKHFIGEGTKRPQLVSPDSEPPKTESVEGNINRAYKADKLTDNEHA